MRILSLLIGIVFLIVAIVLYSMLNGLVGQLGALLRPDVAIVYQAGMAFSLVVGGVLIWIGLRRSIERRVDPVPIPQPYFKPEPAAHPSVRTVRPYDVMPDQPPRGENLRWKEVTARATVLGYQVVAADENGSASLRSLNTSIVHYFKTPVEMDEFLWRWHGEPAAAAAEAKPLGAAAAAKDLFSAAEMSRAALQWNDAIRAGLDQGWTAIELRPDLLRLINVGGVVVEFPNPEQALAFLKPRSA